MAYPVPFEVGALSTSETRVPVWPRDFASFDGAVAEITGEGVRCIVEAPAPAAYKAASSYAVVAAASLIFGLLAIAAAAAIGGLLPRIAAFAVPPMALAGTTVRAEYGASGIGKLSYAVIAPDGRLLQGGPLAEGSGSIPIALPAREAPGAYTLRMVMQGPLGSVDATRVLNAVVAPVADRAKVARIGSISVTPIIAKPGQTIDVSYTATGESGYVRLLGLDGTIWGQKAFAVGGETQFVVPYFSGARGSARAGARRERADERAIDGRTRRGRSSGPARERRHAGRRRRRTRIGDDCRRLGERFRKRHLRGSDPASEQR